MRQMSKFTKGEDFEAFLTSFDRLATVHYWSKPTKNVCLDPQLAGRALEAYSRMEMTETKE